MVITRSVNGPPDAPGTCGTFVWSEPQVSWGSLPWKARGVTHPQVAAAALPVPDLVTMKPSPHCLLPSPLMCRGWAGLYCVRVTPLSGVGTGELGSPEELKTERSGGVAGGGKSLLIAGTPAWSQKRAPPRRDSEPPPVCSRPQIKYGPSGAT